MKKKVGFTLSFAVRFSLVSLEGGGLLIISPTTRGLVVSVGHMKLNLIVFFVLSVFSFPFSFTKKPTELVNCTSFPTYRSSVRFLLLAVTSVFGLLLVNALCSVLVFRCS